MNGLNLYAYCGNNPINHYDPTGHFPLLLIAAAVLLFTPVGGTVAQTIVSTGSYIINTVRSIWDEDVRNDMNSIGWNPFNSDESKVLGSSKVSFYKGVPVSIKTSGRSWSVGVISLNKNRGVNELRHERGHNSQLMMMGIWTYGFTVGIPSPLCLGKWDRAKKYYYAPWETMADILGGVTQRYDEPIPQEQINNAWAYYAISTFAFPFTALYWL